LTGNARRYKRHVSIHVRVFGGNGAQRSEYPRNARGCSAQNDDRADNP